MGKKSDSEKVRGQEATPRWRALFLSCFLCGVCKCSSDQDNAEDGQGGDQRAAREEATPSTSQQGPQAPRRESAKEKKARTKEAKLREKEGKREQDRMRNTPVWFARVVGRPRSATAHAQTNRAATAKASEEEQEATTKGPVSVAEACLETFFRRQEMDQKRLVGNFNMYMRMELIKANRMWNAMPLRDDEAVRKVTFRAPSPPGPAEVFLPARGAVCRRDLDWRGKEHCNRGFLSILSDSSSIMKLPPVPETSLRDYSISTPDLLWSEPRPEQHQTT
ncbi:uncharacterized protein LOC121716060 [Alosa sapidissima]|uniref:uncharacterized protein LOC121716060 n=1 Tax=Alosa sapidissima TaxID=34773 RepID=UPI001C08CFA5|nr:uncharacterized protein LOC121716060 [Alosa sapidissima]